MHNIFLGLQSCPYNEDFRCPSGGCIRSYDICNGFCNCLDCSDERNCSKCIIIVRLQNPGIYGIYNLKALGCSARAK